jgi:hypothetical protein
MENFSGQDLHYCGRGERLAMVVVEGGGEVGEK